MALAPGTRIGPYEVVALIGEGGMGEVYRARDVNLGRQVAIKVLPDPFAQDNERLARFEREAKTLAALKEHGGVYLNAIGGAAQFYARTIEGVDEAALLEFGTPEAMWHLQVRDFPAIVTMDAHGNSLHKDVEEASGKLLATLRPA